jgi:phosphoglycolate phosphatase
MIQHALFDLDGTLIDSLPGIEYAAREALRAVLPGRELPGLRPFIGPPIQAVFARALGLANPELLSRLEQHFRLGYDTEGWWRSVAYDGVADVLRFLAGRHVSCFVVTNKPSQAAQKILKHLGLFRFFQEVVARQDGSVAFNGKAEAVSRLLVRWRLQPNRSVLVGDSGDDADAARICGLGFIGAAYGYGTLDARTTRINAPGELIGLLGGNTADSERGWVEGELSRLAEGGRE